MWLERMGGIGRPQSALRSRKQRDARGTFPASSTMARGRPLGLLENNRLQSFCSRVDGAGERAADAVITGGGVVQAVPPHKGALRQAGFDGALHQAKPRKEADTLLPRCLLDDCLHRGVLG